MTRKLVIGVDIYNLTTTDGIGRCLSSPGGGLNEHIPIVIEVQDDIPKGNRESNGELPSRELLRTGRIQRYVCSGEK